MVILLQKWDHNFVEEHKEGVYCINKFDIFNLSIDNKIIAE